MKRGLQVVSIATVVLVCSSCAHTRLKPNGHYAYSKPVDGWDDQILAKYAADSLDSYVTNQLDKMPFLREYNTKFPAELQAIALAAADYEAAQIDLNRALAKQKQYQSEEQSITARIARLSSQNPVDAPKLQAAEAELVLVEKARASYDGKVVLAKAEVKRTKNTAQHGFEGLGYLSKAVISAKALPGAQGSEINRLSESMDPSEVAYHDLEMLKYRIADNMNVAIGNPANADVILGLGVQYLTSMRRERDRILKELINVGMAFHEHLDRRLFFTRAGLNIGFDGALLATTGAASVTGSESAARFLAALATVIAGFGESVDKQLFFQQNSVALLALMEADRDRKLAALMSGMSKGVDSYTLEQGVADFTAYLLAGDLTSAVKELSEAAAEKSREANTHLQELKSRAESNLTTLQEQEAAEAAKPTPEEMLERFRLFTGQLESLATPSE